MRGLSLVVAVLAALILAGGAIEPSLWAKPPNQQVVAAHFPRPMIFGDALLFGDYVIVHDDDKADQGRACLFVYRNVGEMPLVALHCKRVKRDQISTFKVLTYPLTADMEMVREVQFAGTTFGHQLELH